MTLNHHQLRTIVERKGYQFYDKGILNLNIIGVRSRESRSNQFDDVLLCLYKDEAQRWTLHSWPITTDPGKTYLLQPLHPDGAAILVPGQYPGAFKIGIHGRSRPRDKQYTALEQIKPMRYVRDNNRDERIDSALYKTAKNIFWDNIKSNIHRGNPGWLSRLQQRHLVDGHSAACQVFQYADHFATFMDLCGRSALLYPNSFTYTLLEESDLNGVLSEQRIENQLR